MRGGSHEPMVSIFFPPAENKFWLVWSEGVSLNFLFQSLDRYSLTYCPLYWMRGPHRYHRAGDQRDALPNIEKDLCSGSSIGK